MTYDKIISAFFFCTARNYIPEGLSFSYPIPAQDEHSRPVDHFFLYSMNRALGIPNSPLMHVGIRPEAGATAYFYNAVPSRDSTARMRHGISEEDPRIKVYLSRPLSIKEALALADKYKSLYPKIRQFVFSKLDNDSKQMDLLEKFFRVQFRLFGSQLGDYQESSPEFYSWMLQQLSTRVSFLNLLEQRAAKVSDAVDYLKMAADEKEQQQLLGLSDGEFAFWQKEGNSSLRLLLCNRKLQLNLEDFTQLSVPSLVAARAYNPKTTDKRRSYKKQADEARKIARELRKSYSLTLPVDLDALAEQLGIQVERMELDPKIDGYVQLDSNGEVITLNEKAKDTGYLPRQRFTLAHEIGHVVIPWHTGTTACMINDPTVLVGGDRLVDSQEQEANAFASELLIPTDWLKEQLAGAENLEALLDTVMQETDCSVQASLYAIGRVLPEGEVISFVTSAEESAAPVRLRGPKVPVWKSEETARAALSKYYAEAECFEKGTYTIRRYKKQD